MRGGANDDFLRLQKENILEMLQKKGYQSLITDIYGDEYDVVSKTQLQQYLTETMKHEIRLLEKNGSRSLVNDKIQTIELALYILGSKNRKVLKQIMEMHDMK